MAKGNAECVRFLQRALPRLKLRWAGFRKVRGTVCKRLKRRMHTLGLSDFDAYWAHLEAHETEWDRLDAFCRIPISRFYRDRGVFGKLQTETLPELAEAALARGADVLRVWSLGAASGEEPYTLSIMWQLALAERYPGLAIAILATDSEPVMIERAKCGCYADGSLKELPAAWREAAFDRRDDLLCIRPRYRKCVTLELADVRSGLPAGPFDLILCRNVIFTYFDAGLQEHFCPALHALLQPNGALVLGKHEGLPEGQTLFEALGRNVPIYRARQAAGLSFVKA